MSEEDNKPEEETTNTLGQETSATAIVAESQAGPAALDAAVATVANTPKPKTDELKIVIILKANRAMIGVQSPDCDPVYETMDGDMPAVLAWVPKTVEVARAKWSVSKRNPMAELPKPPPPPPRPATTTAPAGKKTSAKATAAAAAAPAQPKFF